MTDQTTPDDITAAVLASFAQCVDQRLATVMRSLTAHLHAFVTEVGLTGEECDGSWPVRAPGRACRHGRG